MKKLFHTSLFGLILFEIANVYFIMPLPGSQEINSIDVAYFFYTWRWFFRIGWGLIALFAFFKTTWQRRIGPLSIIGLWAIVVYATNFEMAADTMFYQPSQLLAKNALENKVDTSRLIIGIALKDAAKAYPIQFIGYHHQVTDTLAGQPIMVTYCTVCRTGRVYSPTVNGKNETFRLVGMDHFNALFEDKTTGSWWRQSTGEAITGKLKGTLLPELPSAQMALGQWFTLHPNSLVMQPDPKFQVQYDSMSVYETRGKSDLTRTDSLSWRKKSWVVGIKTPDAAKAFDWNRLKTERVINDFVGKTPIVLALANDGKSFVAFERPTALSVFTLNNNTLLCNGLSYNLNGQALSKPPFRRNPIGSVLSNNLKRINAYQEFWHSWETFNLGTEKY